MNYLGNKVHSTLNKMMYATLPKWLNVRPKLRYDQNYGGLSATIAKTEVPYTYANDADLSLAN